MRLGIRLVRSLLPSPAHESVLTKLRGPTIVKEWFRE